MRLRRESVTYGALASHLNVSEVTVAEFPHSDPLDFLIEIHPVRS
jgi:hypothetical protein